MSDPEEQGIGGHPPSEEPGVYSSQTSKQPAASYKPGKEMSPVLAALGREYPKLRPLIEKLSPPLANAIEKVPDVWQRPFIIFGAGIEELVDVKLKEGYKVAVKYFMQKLLPGYLEENPQVSPEQIKEVVQQVLPDFLEQYKRNTLQPEIAQEFRRVLSGAAQKAVSEALGPTLEQAAQKAAGEAIEGLREELVDRVNAKINKADRKIEDMGNSDRKRDSRYEDIALKASAELEATRKELEAARAELAKRPAYDIGEIAAQVAAKLREGKDS